MRPAFAAIRAHDLQHRPARPGGARRTSARPASCRHRQRHPGDPTTETLTVQVKTPPKPSKKPIQGTLPRKVVDAVEVNEDTIPMNHWLRRVNLPDKVDAMRVPQTVGHRPRTGHEEGAREPIRFYVQIKDDENLAMLIIPPQFREVIKKWLVIKPPRVVRLSAAK